MALRHPISLGLSFTGSKDGAAETETCKAAKALAANDDLNLMAFIAQLTEPPDATRMSWWCGRKGG
jgi:hypothetical protein